jgi:hypothetical protein
VSSSKCNPKRHGLATASVLLVVQTGRNASAQLGKIEHLDELLDAILTGPADEVGILTFDSRPHAVKDFTANSDTVSRSLASIAPGDTGAVLFDALHAVVAMFEKAPGRESSSNPSDLGSTRSRQHCVERCSAYPKHLPGKYICLWPHVHRAVLHFSIPTAMNSML